MYNTRQILGIVIAVLVINAAWGSLLFTGVLGMYWFTTYLVSVPLIIGLLLIAKKTDFSLQWLSFGSLKQPVLYGVAGLACSTTIMLIIFLIGGMKTTLNVTGGYDWKELNAVNVLVLLSIFMFASAVFEEIVYRGFFQQYLIDLHIPKNIRLLIISSMFAIGHLPTHSNLSGTMGYLTGTFIMGALTFEIRERTGSIIPPVALHASYNTGFVLSWFLITVFLLHK